MGHGVEAQGGVVLIVLISRGDPVFFQQRVGGYRRGHGFGFRACSHRF